MGKLAKRVAGPIIFLNKVYFGANDANQANGSIFVLCLIGVQTNNYEGRAHSLMAQY